MERYRQQIQELDGLGFPGKTFAGAVLKPVFDTQRDYYYKAFIEISLAHALMLHEQGILAKEDADKLIQALADIRAVDFSGAEYNPAYEDMFFMIEKELAERVGPDVAGRLHIARSRNDIDLCEFRMVLRERLLMLMAELYRLMDVLLALAQENVDTIMPAYTHTQPAQPTTLAHYLTAFYDALARTQRRLVQAYHNVNLCPIGAAAITTTGFPINRERMCELLGFDGLVENSYDAIAGVDYLTEAASALMVLGTDLSRFLKDTLDFCTYGYAYYRLADPYVQISSIMPQKRNPSSLEHARPMASRAVAQAQTVFTMLHNTPFGDMVDSEEQLQPVLYGAFESIGGVLRLLISNFATMTLQKQRMRERANEGFITATELADTLVREMGLSFRQAHRITASIVRRLIAEGKRQSELTREMAAEVIRDELQHDMPLPESVVEKALDPQNFVELRGVTGGPAPHEMRRMLTMRAQSGARDEPMRLSENLRAAEAKLEALLMQYRRH